MTIKKKPQKATKPEKTPAKAKKEAAIAPPSPEPFVFEPVLIPEAAQTLAAQPEPAPTPAKEPETLPAPGFPTTSNTLKAL